MILLNPEWAIYVIYAIMAILVGLVTFKLPEWNGKQANTIAEVIQDEKLKIKQTSL